MKPMTFLALAATLAMPLAALAQTTVFINELHYDDGGSDANEQVEVAGPVGTDLTGWSIVLYNGNNGTVYDTVSLPTPIPAAGVVVVAPAQIQNGGPDGIALVDATGVVVQFLSYEGSFAAVGGPADGMTSIDIGVSENSSTADTESLQLSGTGTTYEDFTWNAPQASTFGTVNSGQSFGAPADVAPTVSATTPVDAATGVAVAANVDISFSEAVTTSGTWADISCANSGNHGFAVSGSGASYSLDPTSDFAGGETCTVTVYAAGVADQDGTADNMAADFSFSFQTLGDTPPEVASTSPTNGSSAPAGSNLSVTFSEPVTLGASWYTLTCDNSGSHTATVSGGPTSWTLDPATDFTALETCTFTVLASAVTDQDGSADAMAADEQLVFSILGSPADYYACVDPSSSAALKASLHDIIKDHVSYPYTSSSTDTWDIINQADQDPNNPNNILDVYENASDTKISGGQGAYNREHTWPNSLGFPSSSRNGQPNPPYTDLHMLYASDVQYNGDRGNKPYGECPSSSCTRLATVANNGFGGGSGDGDANWYEGPDGNQGTFETWDHRKGDVARAVMYMAVRYEGGIDAAGIVEPDLELTDNRSDIVQIDAQTGTGDVAYMGLLSTILDWNELDPPDTHEHLRNELVYSYQLNRNPFIDHPEWARCVFTGVGCENDVIFRSGFDPDPCGP